MLSEELLSRLAQLNRERPPNALHTTGGERALQPPADEAELTLAALAPGEVRQTEAGAYYAVAQPLAEAWPASRDCCGQALAARQAEPDSARHADLIRLLAAFPTDALFLDLETCGFSGSAIFLAGLVYQAEGRLVLEQWLARDYTEERAVLESLARLASERPVLVTFNGKSFDWPMVRDRSAYHRLTWPACFGRSAGYDSAGCWTHVDLLHHARRRWRAWLPNCKLQTLERAVCRRLRREDIPGSQIGQEYHYFVRTGDARSLSAILRHNALDLVTLVELAVRLALPPPAIANQTPSRESA